MSLRNIEAYLHVRCSLMDIATDMNENQNKRRLLFEKLGSIKTRKISKLNIYDLKPKIS